MPKSTAYRFDDETANMINELAKALGTTRTSAIRQAVRKMHKTEITPKKSKGEKK